MILPILFFQFAKSDFCLFLITKSTLKKNYLPTPKILKRILTGFDSNFQREVWKYFVNMYVRINDTFLRSEDLRWEKEREFARASFIMLARNRVLDVKVIPAALKTLTSWLLIMPWEVRVCLGALSLRCVLEFQSSKFEHCCYTTTLKDVSAVRLEVENPLSSWFLLASKEGRLASVKGISHALSKNTRVPGWPPTLALGAVTVIL